MSLIQEQNEHHIVKCALIYIQSELVWCKKKSQKNNNNKQTKTAPPKNNNNNNKKQANKIRMDSYEIMESAEEGNK